jgi:hypothetical protein
MIISPNICLKRGFNGYTDIRIQFVPNFGKIQETLKANVKNARIEDGELIVPAKEIKALFDVCIDKTIALLEQEYAKTKNEIYLVESVLLVGGFSQSMYLERAIHNWCNERRIVLVPDIPKMVTCVSYGAVAYGLKHCSVTRRHPGKSYALLLKENGTETFDYFIKKTEMVQGNHTTYIKEVTLNPNNSSIIRKLCFFGN